MEPVRVPFFLLSGESIQIVGETKSSGEVLTKEVYNYRLKER